MNQERVAIIGAGGHARVIASTLIAAGHIVHGFYDDDPAKIGTTFCGAPILGSIADAKASRGFGRAIVGIGTNDVRKRVAEDLDLDWFALVHPFSWVDPGVEVHTGTVILAGAIVQAGARLGSHVILNTRASVDHDCVVGDYVHVAVAHLAGGASADEGAFIALGSVVLPGKHVGAWATVGAGSLVTRDVAPYTVVIGTPARPAPSAARAEAPAEPPA